MSPSIVSTYSFVANSLPVVLSALPTYTFPAKQALPSQSKVCAFERASSAVPFPTI